MQRILCLILTLACSSHAVCQLMSPREYLPHPFGEEFTPHHQLVAYFNYVADQSPYVMVEEIGRTNEHRPMFLAIVSSPENLARLEDLRLNNLRLAGLEEGTADRTAAKAIVWLGYSVHGNEAGGSEASMQVVYDLASGQQNAHAWLENTIVILEPSVNPDGYNRYTNWNNQVSAIPYDASAAAREHHEPWPGGRVNHYLFDLNRDWAWQTQVESQNRIAAYHRWMPHVVADLHEMGYTSPYYFAPAAQPFHEFISEWQRDFQVAIGKNHAEYFDAKGWTYFTKEIFDLFYPSYGDTYPTFNGAIGMTYEQGGHGFAGRGIVMPNGDTLKLSDRIAHHETTSLSTIEVTSENADRVISEFNTYFKRASSHPPGEFQAYLVKGDQDPGKLKAFCALLDRQGIRYGTAKAATGLRAYAYDSDGEVTVSPSEKDLVIDAHQPLAILTQVLMDPRNRLADSLTYDITNWSLPFAFGLEAYAFKVVPAMDPGYDIPVPDNEVKTNAYGYLVNWRAVQDGSLLAGALKAGINVRFASQSFASAGKRYAPGTLVFLRNDNRHHPDFFGTLRGLANTHGVQLHPVQSGFVELGHDFGSSSYHLITPPRVLTCAGSGVDPNGYGQVWHFFEQTLQYPLTTIDVDDLGNVDLDAFQILILPDGYYSISDEAMTQVKTWMRAGGKVIAIGSALRQFNEKEGFALKQYADSAKADEIKKAEEQDQLDLRLERYDSATRRDISSQLPGAVFKASVDPSHPLGFGLGEVYYTLKTDSESYEHLVDAENVIYLGESPEYYGFVGYKALENQKNSVVCATEQQGQGTIVYLVDNPLFRGFWENGKFLFCNALFFAGN